MFKRRVTMVAVAGLICLVGGCTSADSATRPSDEWTPGGQQSASPTPAEPPPSTQSPELDLTGELPQASWFTDADPPPPLMEYAVYMEGPQETAEDQANERRRFEQQQNAVADCMAELGFRYVPQAPTSDTGAASTRAQANLLALPVPFLADSREQVVHDGYGVMGTPEAQLAEAGLGEDANVTYQASLSSAEADSYSRALYGDYNDPAGTSAASCTGQAMAQFPSPEESSQARSFQADFAQLINAAIASTSADARAGGLDEDERFIGINGEWEACMRTQGYAFEGEGGPAWAMNLAVRTLPDGSAMTIPGGTPGADIPAEAKSLLGTEPERKIAVDDFDCRVETDYMDRLMAIRVARDEEFIAEHQGELDRLVAAAESW